MNSRSNGDKVFAARGFTPARETDRFNGGNELVWSEFVSERVAVSMAPGGAK